MINNIRKRLSSIIITILSVVTFAQLAMASDVTAPVVTAFSISPKTIDTSSKDQIVTLTVTMTDDMSGVCTSGNCQTMMYGTWFVLQSVSGKMIVVRNFTLKSGNDLSGTFEAIAVMPRWAEGGTWSAWIMGADKAGNVASMDSATLEAQYGMGAATITNMATVAGDTTPPQVTAFSMSPATIDTSSGDQTVTLTVTLTDNIAGVRADTGNSSQFLSEMSPTIFWGLYNDSGQNIMVRDFVLKSGDALNGTYAATAVIPPGASPGPWSAVLKVPDRLGNVTVMYPATLETQFGTGAAIITNIATLTDTTPPQVTAFSMSSATIDTSSGDQTVTLTVTLTDDISGICTGEDCASNDAMFPTIGILGSEAWNKVIFAKNFILKSGNTLNGTYEATAVIPQGASPGVWSTGLYVYDRMGNYVAMDPATLEAQFGAGSATITNVASTSDNTPPQVTAFSMFPTTIDTSSGDQTVTLTVTLTDDMSGICTSEDCANNEQLMPTFGFFATDSASKPIIIEKFILKSGNALNGTYEATVLIPRGACPGLWYAGVYVFDRMGNYVVMDPETVVAQFGAGSATVINRGAGVDADAPKLVSFSLLPKTIDTSSSDQTVTLTVTLTDDMAGFCPSITCNNNLFISTLVQLTNESGQSIVFRNFSLKSGSDVNGTYEATAVIAKGSAPGTWSVTSAYFGDKVGHTLDLGFGDLETQFGVGSATITNTAATGDTTPPQLTAFSLSPATIDTSTGDQTVTLTVTLTDDISGFCTSGACTDLWLSTWVMLGNERGQYITFRNFVLKSGDALNGTYEATAVIAKGSWSGSWAVATAYFSDKAGNILSLNAATLDTQFGTGTASVTNVADKPALYSYFESAGIWKNDGSNWSQITTNAPGLMTTSGTDLYATFPPSGIWQYNGTDWSQSTPSNPQSIVTSGSILYGTFTGDGIWKLEGSTWSQITPNNPDEIVIAGGSLYGTFGISGIWKFDGSDWSQVTTNTPTQMVGSTNTLYGIFAGAGIWKYEGTEWTQVTSNTPEQIISGGTNLYGTFAGSGIWKYDGTDWTNVTPNTPQQMTATSTTLYGVFTGTGIWKHDGTSWSQVTSNDPLKMVAGE